MDFHFKKCYFPFQIFINSDSLEFFMEILFQILIVVIDSL